MCTPAKLTAFLVISHLKKVAVNIAQHGGGAFHLQKQEILSLIYCSWCCSSRVNIFRLPVIWFFLRRIQESEFKSAQCSCSGTSLHYNFKFTERQRELEACQDSPRAAKWLYGCDLSFPLAQQLHYLGSTTVKQTFHRDKRTIPLDTSSCVHSGLIFYSISCVQFQVAFIR